MGKSSACSSREGGEGREGYNWLSDFCGATVGVGVALGEGGGDSVVNLRINAQRAGVALTVCD